MFLNLLYFLIFILIFSYLFFSKYLEFCEKLIKNRDTQKNKIMENLNNVRNYNRFYDKINKENISNSNIVIDVECEVINDNKLKKPKGFLK